MNYMLIDTKKGFGFYKKIGIAVFSPEIVTDAKLGLKRPIFANKFFSIILEKDMTQ